MLSQKQYLDAGLSHTSKDLEIEPHHVKKIQSLVNNHVWWAKEIFNCGRNWNQFDRMSTNLKDEGEQVCNMTLLVKDHKQWSPNTNEFPPTRPVVAGNSGLNCHLSEIVSSIIEPIAFEETGNEIDSTNDMLARIEKINKNLSNTNSIGPTKSLKEKVEVAAETIETVESNVNVVEEHLERTVYGNDDIRSYFKTAERKSLSHDDQKSLVDS